MTGIAVVAPRVWFIIGFLVGALVIAIVSYHMFAIADRERGK